jgi:hypothetical protein
MLNFNTYIARHGEIGVQAIIERLERYEGHAGNVGHSLEERWAALMASKPEWQADAA